METVKLAYSIQEIAELLQLDRATVYRLLREKKLHGIRAGKRKWRVSAQALRDFLRGDEKQSEPKEAA